jgi:hypothetical protein
MSVVRVVVLRPISGGLAAPHFDHPVSAYHQEVGEAGTDIVDFAHFEMADVVPFNVVR